MATQSDEPLDSFIAQLKGWLDKVEAPAGLRDYGATPTQDDLIPAKEWQAILHRDGWAGLSWPEKFGGKGSTPLEQGIFAEELARRGLPRQLNIVGLDLVGPVLIEFGSAQQKERHLEAILNGDCVWCQLFSEPEAGSDLASLRSTATPTENGWVLNGQKVWTSGAHYADFGLLLARTGTVAEAHRGLTCFILPMNRQGVVVRPLKQLDREVKFNEVYFNDVQLSKADVLGEEGNGWMVAMSMLGRERMSLAAQSVIVFNRVNILSSKLRSESIVNHSLKTLMLVDIWATAYLLRLTWLRSFASKKNAWLSQIVKLASSNLQKNLGKVGAAIEGPDAMLMSEVDSAPKQILYAVGTSIAGGTSEIQKNIIAERILGLPK